MLFYLCNIVPAIWFLELHELEQRLAHQKRLQRPLVEHLADYDDYTNTTMNSQDLTASFDAIGVSMNGSSS